MIDPSFLLFVPGNRPDRFCKALATSATGIILDLEDAVAFDCKAQAREDVRAFLAVHDDLARVCVRINPPTTTDGRDDLAMLANTPCIAVIVVPKVGGALDVSRVSDAIGKLPQIALIESALGVANCESIAAAQSVMALAFGPYDLAAELGGASDADVMLPHRARVLVAARAAQRWAIDGPSREYGDAAIPAREAAFAHRLGYDGKLLIHPAQIGPVCDAFQPSAGELVQARRVIEAAQRSSPAVLDGAMIDTPIVNAAQRVVKRVTTP